MKLYKHIETVTFTIQTHPNQIKEFIIQENLPIKYKLLENCSIYTTEAIVIL